MVKFSREADIVGDIVFKTREKVDLLERLNAGTWFRLNGKTTEESRPVICSKCYLTNRRETFKRGWRIDSKFRALFATLDGYYDHTIPTKNLLIVYGLVNVHETMGIQLQTKIGNVSILHSPDIKKLEELMRKKNAKVITATATFDVFPNGKDSLRKILKKSSNLVKRVLMLTSLAQTTWHDYAYIRVCELVDPDKHLYREVYLKLRHPAIFGNSTASNFITSIADSDFFFHSAWQGYSEKITKRYGFKLSLQWYIQGHHSDLVESRFLQLTTAFELLMDRFHKVEGGEFILDEASFEQIKKKVKSFLTAELDRTGIARPIQDAMSTKLPELNRRTYLCKARRLLEFWGIDYSDLGLSLGRIKDVRNDITHRGIFTPKTKAEQDLVLKAYLGMFEILTRLYLAMLRFEGRYYSVTRRSVIDFKDVCSKV